jgi:hypothetical protein
VVQVRGVRRSRGPDSTARRCHGARRIVPYLPPQGRRTYQAPNPPTAALEANFMGSFTPRYPRRTRSAREEPELRCPNAENILIAVAPAPTGMGPQIRSKQPLLTLYSTVPHAHRRALSVISNILRRKQGRCRLPRFFRP